MKYILSLVATSLVATLSSNAALAQQCPAITEQDLQGLSSAFPQQFELDEFQAAANCKMEFSGNPDIAMYNSRLVGNSDVLPPVSERLPEEPLVIVPYESVGNYSGVFKGLSLATESGTTDIMSMRHAQLIRFDSDLITIKPHVAKSFEWNDDFTALTFTLRKGHRWSDGEPFTTADVEFWLNNMETDPNVVGKPKSLFMVGEEPLGIEVIDDVTFRFTFAAPNPGFLAALAQDAAQPYQPKHFLGRYHPDISQDADKLAKEDGFESGYDVISHYYGGADWKDVPSPFLKAPDKIANLPAAVVPTLESHLIIEDTTETRRMSVNPYYFAVDTSGQQLPYIVEYFEQYVGDPEVRTLMMLNGDIDYKAQSNQLSMAPVLLDGQEDGNYTIYLKPTIALRTFTFNHTHEDDEKRGIFSSQDFNVAMSHAIDRSRINSVAYLNLGTPTQYIGFSPAPDFVSDEQLNFAIEYDPAKANALLDDIGLVDTDGDGLRELPSGRKLTLNFVFSTQAVAVLEIEIVAQNWTDVGIETVIKEVTTDELRAAQSANELDVGVWAKGRPSVMLQGNSDNFEIPFGDFFSQRNGMLWYKYLQTNGDEGVEPPAWTRELNETLIAWKKTTPGSEEFNTLVSKMIDIQLDNLMFIGTVLAPNVIYRSNELRNFEPFKTQSHTFFRTYPYNPEQWYFVREN